MKIRSRVVEDIRMSSSVWDAMRRLLVPLDPEAMLDKVREGSLSAYDVDPQCREALNILVDSCNAEAGLNLFGRIAARDHLRGLLETRLNLMDYWRRNPIIQTQTVLPPLFITGTPKSGSTFLHRLLAQDPSNRAPSTWEVMFPLPPPERETFDSDPRIAITDKRLRWIRWTRPSLPKSHPIGAGLPQECGEILGYSLQSYVFLDMFMIPSYESWLSSEDMCPAYEFHMRILKHLQWRCPAERWVLKSSDHIYSLASLLRTYPEARVIFLHRDPTRVLQASASQATILKSLFRSSIDPSRVAADQVRSLKDKVDKMVVFRDNSSHLEECFIDVRYLELARDPIATVRAIYDRFGFPLSPAAETRMQTFIEAESRSRRPDKYTLADFSLDPQQEDPRFDLYCERFGVAREPL